MSEFKEVVTPYNQPYFSFFHNKKEYLIFSWVDEDYDVLRVCLAEPKKNTQGVFVANNLVTEAAFTSKVEKIGGTKLFMSNVALPSFNEYLIKQGGIDEDAGFPIDKKDFEQFNWIIKNTLSYVNGKILMSDF